MTTHIRVPNTFEGTYCGHMAAGDVLIERSTIYSQTAVVMWCYSCLREVEKLFPKGVPSAMKPAEALENVIKNEAEKPNKYTILQSDQGRWQILQRSEGASYWYVAVKDCGSMRMATLLLNAILTSAKPGTREHEIMNASNK